MKKNKQTNKQTKTKQYILRKPKSFEIAQKLPDIFSSHKNPHYYYETTKKKPKQNNI